MDWLKETFLHAERAEPSHEDTESQDNNNERRDQEHARRVLISADIQRRDTQVDKRIQALEELADQIRRQRFKPR